MNSQVEPHIPHSISQTRRAFIQTVTMDSTYGDSRSTTKHKKTKCATSSKLKAAQSVSYSLPKLPIGGGTSMYTLTPPNLYPDDQLAVS